MSDADFQLYGVRDPRLAAYATSGTPAWLWSLDGAHILWANAVGARLFGASNAAALAAKTIGPADPQRRQAAQLAARLPQSGTMRLERLRGFGAPFGRLLTCACSRLSFSDGTTGLLIAAAEPVGRPMPLNERLAHLVDGITMAAMTFTPAGALAGANEAAKNFSSLFGDLIGPGFNEARALALRDGQAELRLDAERVSVHRVGQNGETALVALIDPVIVPKSQPRPTPVVVLPPEPPEPEAVATPPAAPAALKDAEAEHAAPPETAQSVASPENIAAPEVTQDVALPTDVFESVFDDAPVTPSENPEPAPPIAVEAQEITSDAPADHAVAAVETGTSTAPIGFTRIIIEDEPRPAKRAPDTSVDQQHTENAAHQENVVHEDNVAHEPRQQPTEAVAAPAAESDHVSATLSEMDGEPPADHHHPLRFIWQMDDTGRFSLGSDEFTRLIGSRTAAAFGRPWSEIAGALGLDPDNRVAAAVATRETWSGIVVHWPVDGSGTRLHVELSALPTYDRAGQFRGYRGFGICRDIAAMTELAEQRRDDIFCAAPAVTTDEPLSATDSDEAPPAMPIPPVNEPVADVPDHPPIEKQTAVDIPQNVVPFPVPSEPKSPALTTGESNAFDEIARRLSARLEGAADPETPADAHADLFEPQPPEAAQSIHTATGPEADATLDAPASAPRATSGRDSLLFDRLPTGMLVYRLDRLLYANRALLDFTGHDSLHALAEAGGLDALFVEGSGDLATSTSEAGTPVAIAPRSGKNKAADARLFAISWDGEDAHALVFSAPSIEAEKAAPVVTAPAQHEDTTQAEELGAILDATVDGVVIFDENGCLISCNRGAEVMFGRTDSDIARLGLIDLFAPDSQRAVLDYLETIKTNGHGTPVGGREFVARTQDGRTLPAAVTLGRTQQGGTRLFAIVRDLTVVKQQEADLIQMRRQADRATSAKADILSRISHEVRMPLNAIIGFADVMIGERFGALGNERYSEYLKDIRASGQRVIAIIDDLLDLSRIESGKLEMSFASQDLNSMVEQCVAVMQPQANRERIIIRTSLAHALPTVKADARALRQIAMNLIGNSIHLANAGGQVIVSTATTDFGDIVLRVRDTGPGLNDNEIAAAMAPFRTPGASDQANDGSVVNLSLTKALVEANRAQFHIKTAPHSGTLIEVVFSHASAIA